MQKWIDEHPGKTYAQDFLKSFRKPSRTHTVCRGCAAQIATAEAVVSPRRLIQIKKKCKCCWDEPMEVIDDE